MLVFVDDFDEFDDLEADIAAEELVRPGTRRRIEEMGEVFLATTRLWQARERLGFTVEQVAEMSGLTPEEVDLVEDNAVDCPFDVLSRYGKVVGLRFDLHAVTAA